MCDPFADGFGPVAVVGALRCDWTLHRAVC